MKILYECLGGILLIVGAYIFAIIGVSVFAFDASMAFENSYQIFFTAVVIVGMGTHFLVRGLDGSMVCRPIVKTVQVILLIIYFMGVLFLIRQEMKASVEDSLVNYFSVEKGTVPGHALISMFGTHAKELIAAGIITSYFLKNIILFAPLGVLLPCIFRIMQSWGYYLTVLVFMSISLELMMNRLGITILDVDSILLHILGGVLAYLICKCSFVKEFLIRWYHMDEC